MERGNIMKNRKTGFTLVELLVVIAIIALLLAVLIPSLNKAKGVAKRTICASQMKQIGIGVSTYVNEYDDMLLWSGPFSFDKVGTIVVERDKDDHPFTVYRCDHSNNDKDYQSTAIACICGNIGKPFPMRLACLYARGQIKDAKILYCPAGSADPERRYDSYTKSKWGNDWGTPHQAYNIDEAKNDWIRTGYGYYPIDTFFDALAGDTISVSLAPYIMTDNSMNAPKYTARKFSKLSRCFPYVSDDIFKRKNLAHKSGINLATNVPRDAGINCLFKDGHVIFAKDGPIKIKNKEVRLFDNDYWSNYDPPRDSPIEANMKARFIFFNVYRFISP
jgi:prepilin-type N-terminal cleavage/methylation domain-containing protein